jgi:hypothetical protein
MGGGLMQENIVEILCVLIAMLYMARTNLTTAQIAVQEWMVQKMATEKRLIDANKLWNALPANDGLLMYQVKRAIRDAPTVDAVEVVHGEWLEEHGFDLHNNEYWVHCCSVCEEQALVDVLWREEQLTDYCPHCGAIMNGGKSEQT